MNGARGRSGPDERQPAVGKVRERVSPLTPTPLPPGERGRGEGVKLTTETPMRAAEEVVTAPSTCAKYLRDVPGYANRLSDVA